MEASRPTDPRRVGDYQVLARLGSGGMGQVFLGRSASGRSVAIKLVHDELAGDPDFRVRFAREVAAARAVGGAFTAPLIDADPDAQRPWLVTTYLPGHSLQATVDRYGPLPPASVRSLAAGLAEALVGIHRAGVVHRDLKPSNVLLTPDGARVIDFGIARAADAGTVTRTGTALGSPGFLPPEQALGTGSGAPGDVFSLGGVLIFASTGEAPFGGGTVPELIYRVVHEPPRLNGIADLKLRAVIAACMEKDPAKRPAIADVLRWLAELAPAAPHGVGWLPQAVATEITRPPQVPPPLAEHAAGGRGDGRPAVGRRGLLRAALAAAAVTGVAGAASAAVLVLRDRPADAAPKGEWTFRPPSAPIAGPLAAGDLVFVAVRSTGGPTRRLVAVDRRTGALRWTADGMTRPNPVVPMHLTIAGQLAYLPGSISLKAIDLRTGSSPWTAPGAFDQVDATPPAAAGLVFTTVRQGNALNAHDAVTGAQRWTFNTGGPLKADPVAVLGSVVCATEDGRVLGVDLATGQARWRFDLPPGGSGEVKAAPVVIGGVYYVIDDSGAINAVDIPAGRRKWLSEPTRGGDRMALGGAGDTVFAADQGGALYAFGTADGKLRWQRTFPGASRNAEILIPGVAGGLAYCFAKDTLYALDLATGKDRWRVGGLANDFDRPALGEGAVHFASGNSVVSFAAATGKVLRKRDAPGARGVTASGGFLYWYDSAGVHAAKG
ncbi:MULTISPECIES: serine/threonine-protein kinase [Thermomonosporaceae]|uniref:serine/threonine-protein kinase n=1 Tax=Thermomonosporaceae TaxID=2012 RepID=UPI00255A8D84|nr:MULTISPECIES: serine/threonine-protein kinase [Thermomonosporaceae]MDL4776546.1 serine/threonine-protein kinase [Actinomadura xylanilytica]